MWSKNNLLNTAEFKQTIQFYVSECGCWLLWNKATLKTITNEIKPKWLPALSLYRCYCCLYFLWLYNTHAAPVTSPSEEETCQSNAAPFTCIQADPKALRANLRRTLPFVGFATVKLLYRLCYHVAGERTFELEEGATGVSSVHCYIMHEPTKCRECISKQ